MKAAVLDKYDKQGSDLTVVEVPMPEMKADEVLVRVHTAGVNPLDNMIVRGEVKLIVPYTMPLVMGNEFCGTIEKTGDKAHGFSVGDRVYGRLPLNHIGAFAEYVAVSSDAIAKVPNYLSDEEATAVPLTALTALQALELLQVKTGDSVFISGGTGSFGAMAIPIAKSRGLKVITNGSASQRDRVISLGADRFIDYKTEDYSKTLHDIDGIIDTLGERELPKEFGILKSGGHLVQLRGLPNGEFAKRMDMPFWKRMLFKLAGMKYDRLAARRQQHYHFIFVHEDGEGLQQVSRLLAEKRIPASVDEVFHLEDVNQALKKVASSGSKGKTILKINIEEFSNMILNIINEEFSVCKVADYEGIDLSSPYIFIGSTDEEKSLVCPIRLVPDNTVERDDGWRAFRIEGVLDFSLIGILAKISNCLAENSIGIFAISTFNTDYILTKAENFEKAIKALETKGYKIAK